MPKKKWQIPAASFYISITLNNQAFDQHIINSDLPVLVDIYGLCGKAFPKVPTWNPRQ